VRRERRSFLYGIDLEYSTSLLAVDRPRDERQADLRRFTLQRTSSSLARDAIPRRSWSRWEVQRGPAMAAMHTRPNMLRRCPFRSSHAASHGPPAIGGLDHQQGKDGVETRRSLYNRPIRSSVGTHTNARRCAASTTRDEADGGRWVHHCAH
jgi:hypothetical protein